MRNRGWWIACLGLAAVAAHAGEWSAAVPVDATAPLQVERLLAMEDGYVLIGGNETTGRWARIGADGSAQVIGPDPRALPAGQLDDSALIAVGSDRLLGRVQQDEQCRMVVLDAQAQVRAIASETGCYGGDPFGGRVEADAEGALWLARAGTLDAARLQADGELRVVPLPADAVWITAFSPLRGAAASYLKYHDGEVGALARIDSEGVTWRWRPASGDIRIDQIRTAANDDAWVIGRVAVHDGAGALYLARVSASGQLRWQRSYPELPTTIGAHGQTGGGDRLLLSTPVSSSGPAPAFVFDANGELLWARADSDESLRGFADSAAVDPRDPPAPFALLLGVPGFEGLASSPAAVEYHAADGEYIATYPLVPESLLAIGVAPAKASVLADGSLALLEVDDGLPPVQALRHYDVDGSALPAPDPQTLLSPEPRSLSWAVASDGASYSLAGGRGQALRLHAYQADGTRLWSAPLRTDAWSDLYEDLPPQRLRPLDRQAPLAIDRSRVCVGPLRSRGGEFGTGVLFDQVSSALHCFDRRDGRTLLALRALPGSAPGAALLNAVALLPDGRIRLAELVSADGSCVLQRITLDASGVEMERSSHALGAGGCAGRGGRIADANALARFDIEGGLTVALATTAGTLRLLRMEADGALSQFDVAGQDSGDLQRMLPTGDGGWVLHSWAEGRHRLRGLGARGQLRWTREWDIGLDAQDGFSPLQFEVGADRVLVASQRVQGERLDSQLELIDARNGQTLSSEAQSSAGQRGIASIALQPGLGLALSVRGRDGEAVLGLQSLDDGSLLGHRRLGCGSAEPCAAVRTLALADGSLRLFAATALARIELESSLGSARIGQAAVSGAWFQPATNGQGLLIDYDARSGQLIAGWFTYAEGEQFGAPGQRWFTLSGAVANAAETATLTIYRNRGGQFDALPQTRAEAVGSARLRLRGCNELVISYRFDEGELAGLAGDMALQRLAPSAYACIDADGGSVAAQPALADLGRGFLPQQSGAWFEPATSGQGLFMEVRPPSADGSDPGLASLGWFTYDPAGAPDDADAQHWFWIEGNLVEAAAGRALLQVYRATSGGFDGRPTRTLVPVGQAELRVEGCGHALLNYQFDDSDLAGSFAGRVGELELSRLFDCGD